LAGEEPDPEPDPEPEPEPEVGAEAFTDVELAPLVLVALADPEPPWVGVLEP
jgi:hypothetical protein